MKYCYIYTGDKNKEDRLKRIDNVLEKIENDVIFAVNDLQSISYLTQKGFKALNVDAVMDLFNLLNPDDEILFCTPEDTTVLKASFANAKEVC
ncbi:MAG: hypothetical protein GXO62_02825 [Epsilonproteobacteria bacterium]|nr:hypothetical protein [Campylobacterota bacterium]